MRRDWSDEEWDGLLAGSKEATFFHTRAWAHLLSAAFPALSDRSLWLETSAGPVLFPFFMWSRAGGLLTTLHSSFPFLYGGPIPARDSRGRDHLPQVVSVLGRPLASLRINGNPFAGPPFSGDPATASAAKAAIGSDTEIEHQAEAPKDRRLAGFTARPDSTHCMILPRTEEEFWGNGLTTAQRNDVRRLGKKGVVVEETREEEAVDSVYRLYLASFEHWGERPRMVYPRRYYNVLVRSRSDAVRLTTARYEGRVIGGAFTVRWNGIVHYMAGYFDRESRALRPNVLIQVESIQKAIRDGFRFYDFLPSAGHVPVETFKESFGGRRIGFTVWERRGPLHRLLPGRWRA